MSTQPDHAPDEPLERFDRMADVQTNGWAAYQKLKDDYQEAVHQERVKQAKRDGWNAMYYDVRHPVLPPEGTDERAAWVAGACEYSQQVASAQEPGRKESVGAKMLTGFVLLGGAIVVAKILAGLI